MVSISDLEFKKQFYEPYDETGKPLSTLREISSKSRQVAHIFNLKNSSFDFRIKQEKRSPT